MIDPTVQAQMLIRRPLDEVFDAFVDPTITTRFWFTRSTGKLEPGAKVTWEWEMYGASADIHVEAIERPSRILIRWGGPSTTVEWQFTSHGAEATLVRISTTGFRGPKGRLSAWRSTPWAVSLSSSPRSRHDWSTESAWTLWQIAILMPTFSRSLAASPVDDALPLTPVGRPRLGRALHSASVWVDHRRSDGTRWDGPQLRREKPAGAES